MSSIKAGIAAKLAALAVTPHVFHRRLPKNPKYPATVFDIVADAVDDHTHDDLVTGFRKARIQIDVFAESVTEAEDAMEAYVAALAGFAGSLGVTGFEDVSIFDVGANEDFEFEGQPTLEGLEGRSRDFRILY